MKQILISLLTFSFAVLASSADSEVWTVEKDVMTKLGKMGCIAQTVKQVDVNGTTEEWTLQVVSLKTENNDYTLPMVVAFPNQEPMNEYFEAVGRRDDLPRKYKMRLLQPKRTDNKDRDTTIVATSRQKQGQVVGHIKAGNNFTVDFMSNGVTTRSVEFSLSGSSAAIKDLESDCN